MCRDYWYVTDGDGKRRYLDVFIRFGVMLIGSGALGDFIQNKEVYRQKYHGYNYVRAFAEDGSPGDN